MRFCEGKMVLETTMLCSSWTAIVTSGTIAGIHTSEGCYGIQNEIAAWAFGCAPGRNCVRSSLQRRQQPGKSSGGRFRWYEYARVRRLQWCYDGTASAGRFWWCEHAGKWLWWCFEHRGWRWGWRHCEHRRWRRFDSRCWRRRRTGRDWRWRWLGCRRQFRHKQGQRDRVRR